MHIDNENEERRLLNLRDASIQEVLPQYFAARYPKFVSLLQRYYEFEDDSDSPSILLKHLFATRDINQTDITLLSYIEDELLLGDNWAFGLPDVRAAANFSNTLFRTKGTKYSIEWFFRSFFDLDPEIFYPKQDIFNVGESLIGAASNKFLTDDKLYQTFAINIKSALPVSEWFDLYKLFVHPAGMYLGNTTLVVGENDEVVIQTDSAEAEVSTRPTPTFTMTPYIRGIQTDSAGESDRVYLQITSTDALDQYYFWYIKRTTTDSDDFVFPPGEEQPTIRYREPVLVQNDSGQMYIDINWNLDIEGPEQFRVYLQEEQDSGNSNDEILATQVITINDKYYTVAGTGTSGYEFTDNGVDEGATLNIRIAGQNIPDADSVGHPYAPLFFIDHITTDNNDFVGTPPVGLGNAVPIVMTNGEGFTSLQMNADNLTEGSEFFKMRLFDKRGRDLTGYYPNNGIDVKVFDTSKTPLAVTQIVGSPSAFLDEGVRVGDVFGATINAENVHPFRNDSSVFVEIAFLSADASDFASPLPGVSGVPRLPATLVSVDGGITATVFIDSIATVAADGVADDGDVFHIDVYDELTGGTLLLRRSLTISDLGISITPSSATPTEGDTVTFDIEITGNPADGPTGDLFLELAHGTTVDADFTSTPPTAANGRATVPYNTANTPAAQYSIGLQVSDGDDDGETFSLHAYNYITGGVNLASSGTITITDLPPSYALQLFASPAARTAGTPTVTTFDEGDTIYGRVITSDGAENETVTMEFINTASDARFTDTATIINSAIGSYDFDLVIGDNTTLFETSPAGLAVQASSPRNSTSLAITVNEDDIAPTYTLALFSDAPRTISTTTFTEGDTIYGHVTSAGTAQGETINLSIINGDARTTDTDTVINAASGTYTFELLLGADSAFTADPGASVRATSIYDTEDQLIVINNQAQAMTDLTGPTEIDDGGAGTTLAIDPTTINSLAITSPYVATSTFTLLNNGDFQTTTTPFGGPSPAVSADNWAEAGSQGTGFGGNYQVRVLSYNSTSYTFGDGTLSNPAALTATGSSNNNQGGSTTWDNGASDWFRLDQNFTMSITVAGSGGSVGGNRRMIDIEIKEFDGTNYGTGTTFLTHRLQLAADYDGS